MGFHVSLGECIVWGALPNVAYPDAGLAQTSQAEKGIELRDNPYSPCSFHFLFHFPYITLRKGLNPKH